VAYDGGVHRPATQRRAALCLGLVLCLCGLLRPGVAAANALDVFGCGARGAALSGAQTATAEDACAVYANPAALLLAPRSEASFGLMVSHNSLGIRLAPRPAGYDPPDLGSNSPSVPYSYRLRARADTDDVPGVHGFWVGGVTHLGIQRLRLGFLAFLPLVGMGDQRTYFADEREQFFSNQLHFELMGERLRTQVVMVGAAYRIISQLSLGLGLTWMPSTRTDTYNYLDNPADQSHMEMDLDVSTGSTWGLQGGLLLEPTPWLKLAISYRQATYLAIRGTTEIQVRGFHGGDAYPLYQEIDQALHFSPARLSLGLSLVGERGSLHADLQHYRWSEYLDLHAAKTGFADTWTPHLGLEWLLEPGLRLQGGLAWEPSPVPDQDGRTNYVDNDRVGMSAGLQRALLLSDGRTLTVGAFLHASAFPWRSTEKQPLASYPSCAEAGDRLCDEVPDTTLDSRSGEALPAAQGLQTGNPGFPGFSSGGWAFAAGAEARWSF